MKNLVSRGFTLIELLVVIAIIGMLASIVLASLNTARFRAQDATRISGVKALKTALEIYYNDNNGYPTSNIGNGDVPLNDPTLVGKLVPTYIPSMPAILVADGDRYYALGATSGVQPNGYDMLIYINKTNSRCRAGTVPGSTGNWGTPAVCNF